jgi:hypothetical protein
MTSPPYHENEDAARARDDAPCTGYAISAMPSLIRKAWWDAHDELHRELALRPWQWPCVPRNPHVPGSPPARKWRPSGAQRELQDQLEAARRAAIN